MQNWCGYLPPIIVSLKVKLKQHFVPADARGFLQERWCLSHSISALIEQRNIQRFTSSGNCVYLYSNKL